MLKEYESEVKDTSVEIVHSAIFGLSSFYKKKKMMTSKFQNVSRFNLLSLEPKNEELKRVVLEESDFQHNEN